MFADGLKVWLGLVLFFGWPEILAVLVLLALKLHRRAGIKPR